MEEQMAKVLSFGASGVRGFPVQVEVFSTGGMPGMEIIGLPDASVRESRERVNAAILTSGRRMMARRVTINLAPADIRKEGPAFDLPIAVGLLAANLQVQVIPQIDLSRTVIFGELSLDGRIQSVRGALAMVISASEAGYTDVILPADNANEVACIEGMRIYPARTLSQVIDHLEGTEMIPAQTQKSYHDRVSSPAP